MEFNEKLQELRKSRGLTQEELAAKLYVSRTAISKWESGRGVPNIESLKAISKFFSVSIDELLSSGELLVIAEGELLVIAEGESRERECRVKDLVFGLLDFAMALLIFLPLFGQSTEGYIEAVSLIRLNAPRLYLRIMFYDIVSSSVVCGIMTLALQSSNWMLWRRTKRSVSVALSIIALLIFVLSRQTYAAVFVLAFLALKAILLIKRK